MEIKNFCANLVNQISTEGNLLLDLDDPRDDIHDLGQDIRRGFFFVAGSAAGRVQHPYLIT